MSVNFLLHLTMKKILLFLIILLSLNIFRASAQGDGVAQLLKTAPGDATKLIDAFANPLFKGFGNGINNGWTNTAKTKGLLGFELRVSGSAIFTPSADKTFDITQIGLSSNIRPKAGTGTVAPTFGGANISNPPTLQILSSQGLVLDEFQLPTRQMPVNLAPQIQLTAGLIKHTDVTLRAIPKFKINNDIGKVSMFGVGFKHNIMEDFFGGVGGKLIPFDLAIAAGYTRLNYEKALDVRPSTGRVPEAASAGKTDFSNQRIEGHFSGFNLQAIISKKFLVFTPFAAVGFNTAKTDVGLLGNYPVTSGLATYTVYTDPVTINKNSVSNFKLDAGFQLDLAFFKFYASGSLGQYKSVTAGIGIGI